MEENKKDTQKRKRIYPEKMTADALDGAAGKSLGFVCKGSFQDVPPVGAA